MQVITTGGQEIGQLELSEEGHKLLAGMVDADVPLKITFDLRKVHVQSTETGETTFVELVLSRAAITRA